eukprot:1676829-Alexandrium_andersonii.AAC.1
MNGYFVDSQLVDFNHQKELFKYSLSMGKCKKYHPRLEARVETSPDEDCSSDVGFEGQQGDPKQPLDTEPFKDDGEDVDVGNSTSPETEFHFVNHSDAFTDKKGPRARAKAANVGENIAEGTGIRFAEDFAES